MDRNTPPKNNWDILLEEIDDPSFKKTGDFKIDPDDRKAILLLNAKNPLNENIEEVIVHELLHLKLYPLDQMPVYFQKNLNGYRWSLK